MSGGMEETEPTMNDMVKQPAVCRCYMFSMDTGKADQHQLWQRVMP